MENHDSIMTEALCGKMHHQQKGGRHDIECKDELWQLWPAMAVVAAVAAVAAMAAACMSALSKRRRSCTVLHLFISAVCDLEYVDVEGLRLSSSACFHSCTLHSNVIL